MKPNRSTYPTGKEIIAEIGRGDRKGSKVNNIIETLLDTIPQSKVGRGRPEVMAWLYKLIREHYFRDGRMCLNHEETILKLSGKDLTKTSGVGLIEVMKARMLSRAGKKGGSKKII